ncbi:unnamed protein product [Orchesella dallaii]|uniref:Fe2OG dioxygenase domain-containing protein n=1 Tax=Orchesella dallaii TaxID=48710 RepID=A0ABP1RD60_9HEXA
MAGSDQTLFESKEVKMVHILEEFDLNNIKKTDIDLTRVIHKSNRHSQAFTLEHVFTPSECERLIEITEKVGYTKVPVNYGAFESINEDVRSGFRTIVDDVDFAEKLWGRIAAHIPQKLMGAKVVGLNERFRFLKYNSNQFFAPHCDGCYTQPLNKLETSLITIQMYLNDNFDGGETTFMHPRPNKSGEKIRIPVRPKTGMVLIFTQDLFHEGSVVKSGYKYTVRTDIMYSYGTA